MECLYYIVIGCFFLHIDPVNMSGSANDYTLSLYNDPPGVSVKLEGTGLSVTSPITMKLEDGTYKAFIQLICNPPMVSMNTQSQITVNNNVSMGNNPVTGSPWPVLADIYIADAPLVSTTQSAVVLDQEGSGARSCSYIRSGSYTETDFEAVITLTRMSDGLKMAENVVRKYLVK